MILKHYPVWVIDMYGVFPLEDSNDTHVVECDEDGMIKEPHTLDAFCVCEPEVEDVEGFLLFTHKSTQ